MGDKPKKHIGDCNITLRQLREVFYDTFYRKSIYEYSEPITFKMKNVVIKKVDKEMD